LLYTGRSGRAGRSGEAITFFTDEDKPFLRNIANVLVSSGCEVPSWMVAMPKLKSRKHRVDRDHISILTDED
jgi:ATP-dependent RNA helicase DDX52/ROK1